MMHEIDDGKKSYQSKRRKLIGLLGLTLLAGCDNMFGWGKKKPVIDPEHGKEIERNWQKFRVYVVGGVRFNVPVSHHVGQVDPDGFDMSLLWPNIPPGKAPGIKFTESPPDRVGNKTSNQVEVIVRTSHEGARNIDAYAAFEQQRSVWASPDYISRDDAELGLRLFAKKSRPNEAVSEPFFREGYALNNEVLTPYYRLPVVVQGGYIYFIYAPNIHVRISMLGWGMINPNWKGIYLGVAETLNNYQESK